MIKVNNQSKYFTDNALAKKYAFKSLGKYIKSLGKYIYRLVNLCNSKKCSSLSLLSSECDTPRVCVEVDTLNAQNLGGGGVLLSFQINLVSLPFIAHISFELHSAMIPKFGMLLVTRALGKH